MLACVTRLQAFTQAAVSEKGETGSETAMEALPCIRRHHAITLTPAVAGTAHGGQGRSLVPPHTR